jgi:hypothetical protein
MVMMTDRILLARIGWMKYYSGSRSDDPKPIGGGGWNDEESGSELCNFRNVHGTLYGFVAPPGRRHQKVRSISLERIDPAATRAAAHLDGVTVIFVAPDKEGTPGAGRQRIIGWYRNARVLRQWQVDPTRERDRRLYNLTSKAKDAVLLPTRLRHQPIPKGTPGDMGQANVWYPHDHGKPRQRQWLKKAIAYINAYQGVNLLTNPEAELAEIAEIQLEQARGFESNSSLRRIIEKHAMAIVTRDYRRQRYTVEDKHKTESYDLLCTKSGTRTYVEVKGTRTRGEQIILTENERKLAAENKVDLCIVHSIRITKDKKPTARGGTLVQLKHWNPRNHQLEPIAFVCTLSRQLASRRTQHSQ